jgi:hypothetical protein
MTEFPLTGGCNCGAVRFEVTARLLTASYCHCRRCQRRSGAAASANAHPEPDTFRIVAGEDSLRVWRPDDGGEKWFCGDCGSSLFGRNPHHPDPIGIRIGTFDAIPGSGRPSANSWPTPLHGSRYQTTACPVTPRVATNRANREPVEPVGLRLRPGLATADIPPVDPPEGLQAEVCRAKLDESATFGSGLRRPNPVLARSASVRVPRPCTCFVCVAVLAPISPRESLS